MVSKERLIRAPDGRWTLVAQAGEHLRYLGRVRLGLARGGDGGLTIVSRQADLLELDDSIPLDPSVTALIARLAEETPNRVESEATR